MMACINTPELTQTFSGQIQVSVLLLDFIELDGLDLSFREQE